MAIETITEQCTRELLRKQGYYDNAEIMIEEKQSQNDAIRALLKNASKSTKGNPGYPEFIISKKGSNILIVIECKSSPDKHESRLKDKPKNFAVDGVLHYAKFLKNQYNVIAIAISGQSEENIKQSFFIWRKKNDSYNAKDWSSLSTYDDYISRFTNKKNMLSIQELRSHARKLHNDIRSKAKLKEAQKPLFVGALLLALDSEEFTHEYPTITNPKRLAKRIIDAIKERLERSEMTVQKVRSVVEQFEFIKSQTHLIQGYIEKGNPSYKNNVLHKMLCDIHDNIYPSMSLRPSDNVDYMGEFYREFIRYTGGDGKGLGIVLTPPHITELFVELADVNRHKSILDICAGTGGFLVAAMSKMLKGDLTVFEIENIKKNKLCGVEAQPDIFALACVNMFIRGDGKGRLFKQDSLIQQNEFKNKIDTDNWEKYKNDFNVGLINPPYSQKNQKELAFVKKMLDSLSVGGKGIAIVPIRCTASDNELREQILKNHTLDAVMTMPFDLFTDTSTHTCIMVFTAKKPHANSSVWFSIWNDDGFHKLKNNRVDRYNKWNTIKKKWLNDYNTRSNNQQSLSQCVSHSDEWSALAYLDTDYSSLKISKFINTTREHKLCFLRKKKIIDSRNYSDYISAILALPLKEQKLFGKIHDNYVVYQSNWRKFKILDLFEICGSATTPLDVLLDYENTVGEIQYPYVTTKSSNNGVYSYFSYYTEERNVLTVDSATIGYVSYQYENFSASDHVEILKPKFIMNKYIALFLQTLLNLENFRYGYGRKFNQARIEKTMIYLPVKNNQSSNFNPDFNFMEKIIFQISDLDWME